MTLPPAMPVEICIITFFKSLCAACVLYQTPGHVSFEALQRDLAASFEWPDCKASTKMDETNLHRFSVDKNER